MAPSSPSPPNTRDDLEAQLRVDIVMAEEFGTPRDVFKLEPVSEFSQEISLDEVLKRSPEQLYVEDITTVIRRLVRFGLSLTEEEVGNLESKISLIPPGQAKKEIRQFRRVYGNSTKEG